MKSYIYLLNAHTDREGHFTVLAFANKKDAEALKAECLRHDEVDLQRPISYADDTEWSAYQKRYDRWAKKHPAGRAYDSYEVCRCEVRGAK